MTRTSRSARSASPLRGSLSCVALRLQRDSRLVELTCLGKGLAFEVIVERYREPLLRYARQLLPCDRAEDVVQQAFCNAFAALRNDDRPAQLKPWLYRISHNVAVNALEKNGWDYDPLPDNVDGVPQPPAVVAQRAQVRELLRQIAGLPERQRSALILREFEGRSYEEIASELEATPPIVRQLLNRARKRLRDGLGLLVPLPVLRALLAGATPVGGGSGRLAEAAASAGATGGLAKVGVSVIVAATMAGAGAAVTDQHDARNSPNKQLSAAPLESPRATQSPLGRLADRSAGPVSGNQTRRSADSGGQSQADRDERLDGGSEDSGPEAEWPRAGDERRGGDETVPEGGTTEPVAAEAPVLEADHSGPSEPSSASTDGGDNSGSGELSGGSKSDDENVAASDGT